jgi:hypothetical protein
MIGIETIQILQAIFFMRIMVIDENCSALYALESLKYVNGYNYLNVNQSRDYPIGKKFTRLNLSKDALINININLALIFIGCIILSIHSVIKYNSIDERPKDALKAAK